MANYKTLVTPLEGQQTKTLVMCHLIYAFCSASEKFLDGGLVGNNPILDTLTEIEEWNMAVRAKGRECEVFTPTVVVSLGCGKPPVMLVSYMDALSLPFPLL